MGPIHTSYALSASDAFQSAVRAANIMPFISARYFLYYIASIIRHNWKNLEKRDFALHYTRRRLGSLPSSLRIGYQVQRRFIFRWPIFLGIYVFPIGAWARCAWNIRQGKRPAITNPLPNLLRLNLIRCIRLNCLSVGTQNPIGSAGIRVPLLPYVVVSFESCWYDRRAARLLFGKLIGFVSSRLSFLVSLDSLFSSDRN